jgi:hypothetical protein
MRLRILVMTIRISGLHTSLRGSSIDGITVRPVLIRWLAWLAKFVELETRDPHLKGINLSNLQLVRIHRNRPELNMSNSVPKGSLKLLLQIRICCYNLPLEILFPPREKKLKGKRRALKGN